jgi:hypothetical protein
VPAREPPPNVSTAPAAGSSRVVAALAVFALVLSASSLMIARRCPLGYLGGLVDEHFVLGVKLRLNGTLGPARDEPSTLRPPGYPLFVAIAVATLGGPPDRMPADAFRESAHRAVYAAQAMTLAATAAMLFLWLSRPLGRSWALTAALVFGLHPSVLILVGLLHYAVLHLALVVGAAWTLQRGLGSPRARVLLGAGMVAGLANLVRPVMPLLPALVLGAALVGREPARRALGRAAAFAAGMAIVLAPWAARNWALTGRAVFVGDSGWSALWGQTVHPLAMDPARYEWYDVIARDFEPIFARATGSPGYDYLALTRNVGAVERAFRAEALANLRRQPSVYAGNVARALRSYLFDVSPIFLDVYREVQAGCRGRTPEIPREWFEPGGRAFGRSPRVRLVRAASVLLTVVAGMGLVVAGRRRDGFVVAPALVLAAMALTHALVLLSPMHHYSKLPLVVALAAYTAAATTERRPRLARALQAIAVTATAALAVAILA